ncbi:MFS transporter [Actinoallomurus iriomotensis]|uniref:MFS transporter n=1 Tax=Actinoallomurus iriomotensis TaxID=478107 RepID=A0A9W6RYI2_9ACTN|nr:MFS transporter [Actinoallomurus iriomotensis]GLY82195.1 MFS transporter [Actinoallomurus iriomotensis]
MPSEQVDTATGRLTLSTAPGRWVLTATVLGSSLAMLDATIVNVALPRIGRDFGASLAGLQWTVNAYTLTLAGLILLGGSLGDRFGRRRVFQIGVIWFAVASALCGGAPDIGVLVTARALQGIGGALLTPGALAIIQSSFDPADRSRAIGAWSGLGGVAGAIGPFLGGWLIAAAGWRWAFLLNLPLAVLVVAVAARHVPESRDESEHHGFDVLGAVLAAAALAGVTYALTEAPSGPAAAVVVAAVLGVAAGVAFVLVERRRSAGHGPSPMLPLGVFGSRQFTAVNIVTFIVYGGMGVQFFLLVVDLQVVAGYSPIVAGTALLPVTILMLLLSARAGALAQRFGPRYLMTGGLIVAAAGMTLTLRIGPHASYVADVLPAAVVFGLGLSGVVAPLTATVLATADPRHAGVASGVNNAVARAAGLLAVAGIPPAVGLRGTAYNDPAVFGHGFHTAMAIAAVLLLVGAVLTFLIVHDDVLSPDQATASPECEYSCPVGAPPLEPGTAANA